VAFLDMKKITIALSALSLFLAISSNAQEKTSFISIQAGTSIPLGKFHDKELPQGGFATTGLSGSLEGAWFFKPWLGVGANVGFNMHPVDSEALSGEKLAADPFLTKLVIRSEPYTSPGIYAGLFFSLQVREKLHITFKALGGMIYARTPYQLNKAEYYLIGKNWHEKTPAGDYEFSWLGGAGLRYDLNDYLGFALNSEFTYNQCEFDFVIPGGSIRTDQIVISFVNISGGIVFKL